MRKSADPTCIFALLSLFALCLSPAAPALAQGAPVPLFELAGAAAPEPLASPAAVRVERVVVDTAALEGGTPLLGLPLPDGLYHQATLQRLEVRGDGDVTWRGQIGELPVVLTLKNGYAAGLIYTPGSVWELTPAADGGQRLLELDQSLYPPCAGGVEAPETRPAPVARRLTGGLPPAPSSGVVQPRGGVVNLDVMSLYTAQARDAAGGVAQVEALIQSAVDLTNTAFGNSGIDAQLTLVRAELSDRNDSGNISADLSWLAGSPQVAAVRELYQADLVSLIVNNGGGFCGVGFVMRNPGPGFESSAFQVTALGCAVGNLSYAHEHGHNLGCEHDPANGTSPGNASYTWSFGHFIDGSYRTVMSYSNQCTQGCTRQPYFSNPDVSFMGAPTGIADQRDNHRTLNLTAPIAAAFRAGLVELFTDGFESGDASAWTAAVP